jgi:hypothetical protein
MFAVNKKAFMPSLNAIKDKYYELFRGRGYRSDEGGEAEVADQARAVRAVR